MNDNQNTVTIPTGVKILSILYYIGAVFGIIFGIAFLFGAGFITSLIPSDAQLGDGAASLGSAVLIGVGIVFLIFGIVEFFIGRALWKLKNWARVLVVIFSAIGIFFGVLTLFTGNFSSIIGVIINGLIVWYLAFKPDIKAAFS